MRRHRKDDSPKLVWNVDISEFYDRLALFWKIVGSPNLRGIFSYFDRARS
jgi:hypothetical protein